MRTLVVLGDGGHTIQILRLVELLGPDYEYHYMMSASDRISEAKIKWRGPVYRVPLPLGKYSDGRGLGRALRASSRQLSVFLRVRPAVILSMGANIAVPISVIGRVMGAKVIHVESASRVYSISATGKLMYRVAHLFFVQWESLQKDYPKAIYAGRLR